ncbi:transcriptional regulator family: Fungal Specific TF [Penicillium argentinense]|uniref:Transcriptional regulator family: Fungal Specific TF n=1 Tax=Penicillium argentinense TaxID=1131581 RepID=A0A9W9FP70_9EURO|nr:transcriptional regulator family: Fungal Specific TF [Penicillium argentinense]KAJ5103896.1 transcriptional regulator family: Fungal Specific TF [Penicillium argentinense]
MASPSSVSTRLEDHEPDWQYGLRAKRRKRASTAGTSRPSPREIGFMRESQTKGSASFLGSSSGIHFVRHVCNAFARRSADLQQSRARDRSSVPGEDDRLHQGTLDTDGLWTRNEVKMTESATFVFEDLVKWTRGYFENWHPIFPCLHAPTVLQALEKLGKQGTSLMSHLEMLIIRSIISISLADSRQIESPASKIGPVPASLVFHTVRHVMCDVQKILAEPTTLPLLQAVFTAQLALTSLLRLNAASRIGGVITRTAFHLGLHRCPGRFSVFSDEEIDIRRRLFWSIYCLERYLSQALGIPLGIRDDDIDVCYPGDEKHVTRLSVVQDDQRLRLLSHLAKFARVRGLILELRNKSIMHSRSDNIEASRVNGELSQWWNEVYDDVNPIEEEHENDDPDQKLHPSPYHRLLLMILRHEAIISMNRPLLAAGRPSPEYKNALQTCIASSRTLLVALKRYKSPTSDAPLTWPSFTWTTWMACLILMYASWEGELPVSTALKYAGMGISVLENLAFRGSSWPETCIEAIKGMESALTNTNSTGSGIPGAHLSDQPQPGAQADRSNARCFQTPNKHPAQHTRDHRSVTLSHRPPQPDDLPTARYQHGSSTLSAQPFDNSIGSSTGRTVDPGESAIISPFDAQESGVEMPADGLYPTGQSSAGLIFGNMVDANAPLYPGIAGHDPLPFSDPSSLFMSDLWSLADGPWMIHGNLL